VKCGSSGAPELRSYSNHTSSVLPTLRRLDRRLAALRNEPVVVSPAKSRFTHEVEQRLPPEAIQQLVVDHESRPVHPLTHADYGLGKGVVLRLLAEAGVGIRHQGLTADDQAAVQLYVSGWSAARVDLTLGCSPDHVLACVRKSGHPTRPQVGGRRKRTP